MKTLDYQMTSPQLIQVEKYSFQDKCAFLISAKDTPNRAQISVLFSCMIIFPVKMNVLYAYLYKTLTFN
jgi:hypothetical protein